MPQIKSVRQGVPAPQQNMLGSALQGASKFLQLKQAQDTQEKREILSLLPVMAQMKMLEPAQAGEEGAIDAGGGNYVKIVPRGSDMTDEYRKEQIAASQWKRGGEGQKQAAFQKWFASNPIELMGKNEQEQMEIIAQKKAQLGIGVEESGDDTTVFSWKNVKTGKVEKGTKAEYLSLSPEQQANLEMVTAKGEKKKNVFAEHPWYTAGGALVGASVLPGILKGAGGMAAKTAGGVGSALAGQFPASASMLSALAGNATAPMGMQVGTMGQALGGGAPGLYGAGSAAVSPLAAAGGITAAALGGGTAGNLLEQNNVLGLGSGMNGNPLQGYQFDPNKQSGWLGNSMANLGGLIGNMRGQSELDYVNKMARERGVNTQYGGRK